MKIVEANNSHIPDLARIHLASKLAAETNIVDPDYLATFSEEIYQEKWSRFLKAEDSYQYLIFEGDIAVGLTSFGKLRTPPPGTSKIRPLYSSEIYAIYVHPDYFGKGVGKALMKHAADTLITQGHKTMCLWAIDKNKRACSFYNTLGGERVGKQMTEMGRYKVKEACYAWRALSKLI